MLRLLTLSLLAAVSLYGQVTVSGTLKIAAGNQTFTGQVTITSPYMTYSGTVYLPGTKVVSVVNGVFSVSLYPNVGATPANTYYRVTYQPRMAGAEPIAPWTEIWEINTANCTSSVACTVDQVRRAAPITNTSGSPLTNPLTTAGDMLYYNNGLARRAIGAAGQLLTVAAGLPAWTSVSTALASWTGSASVTTVGGLTAGGFGGAGDPGRSIWDNATGQLSFSTNDLRSAVKLQMSSSDSPTWDGQPVGALEIAAPSSPSTRNFVSGLLVTTYSDTIDKSRGIFIDNAASKSDGMYVHNLGGGVGIAVQTQDTGTPTTNSYGYANQVNSQTSIGFYTYSTAGSGGPKLHWLEQRATSVGSPASVITITGDAAHVAEQIDNAGGNTAAVARRITNGAGQIIHQESAQVPAIELGNVSAASAPTIDLHSSGNGNDYDVRLSASGGTGASGFGGLVLEANTFAINAIPLLYDRGEKPTCSVSYRGAIWTDFGGAGVADAVEICTKDASGNYAWRTLI